MSGGNWHAVTGGLREEFKGLLDAERLRALHRTSGLRHAVVAVRQALLAVAAGWAIVVWPQWYVWIPAALLLGFVVFWCLKICLAPQARTSKGCKKSLLCELVERLELDPLQGENGQIPVRDGCPDAW